MIVFREEATTVDRPPVYDLWVDGRIAEYDVARDEFEDALRRRRLDRSDGPVYVEDLTGHRTRYH